LEFGNEHVCCWVGYCARIIYAVTTYCESTSCRISSVPLGLVMSLIVFAQSAIAFMTLSAWVMVGLVMVLCLKLTVPKTRSLLVALTAYQLLALMSANFLTSFFGAW